MVSIALKARAVKSRADFLAIAGRYTRLRRSGRQHVGLCPLHLERDPSFYVHAEKKIWKCFGCGAGGDVIDFIRLAEGLDFVGALNFVFSLSREGASGCAPQSGARLDASGRAALPARAAGTSHSQYEDERAQVIARLDATEDRLRRIRATNARSLASLATACEPCRSSSEELEVLNNGVRSNGR